jgi:hypothetical protein
LEVGIWCIFGVPRPTISPTVLYLDLEHEKGKDAGPAP